MAQVKLTKNNFIDQVVRHGYFAEQIPICFSSETFADNVSSLLLIVECDKKYSNICKKNNCQKQAMTIPTTLSTYKNDISRRVLSLPNPLSFLVVVKLMAENWEKIQSVAKSENSLSPITYIHSYSNIDAELLNSENVRESRHSKSDFINNVKDCIKVSLGYKYRLKIDIANCYNSIYTHSVGWAMCGKEQVKKYMRTKQPQTMKEDYEFADLLDTFLRYQKNNETNGIVVGPFTSRIFSEIILGALDRKLKDKGYHFRRYVDDYKFYFRTETEAQESLPIIEKIFNEYNLNLNTAKTEISRYPFEIISQMNEIFKSEFKRDGVFGVLNIAAKFHSDGEKGAYKYALKFIRGKAIPLKDVDVIFPSLINIMLLNPKYGRYVVDYLKSNIENLNVDVLSRVINKELDGSIANELQEETLLFLQIIRELGLTIKVENIIKVVESGDDFSILIALDIWKNNKKSVIRTRKNTIEFGKILERFSDSLKGEQYSGARWLLLHEISRHKLLDKKIRPTPDNDLFFEELAKQKVSFYKSIKGRVNN